MTMAQRFSNYAKVMIPCSIVILTTQFFNNLKAGKPTDFLGCIIGLIIISIICLLAMLVGEVKALKKIPTFAWASLISLLLTTPFCPLADVILKYTGFIGTSQIGTVILAVAGISIGTRLADVKKLSWKIVLVSILVFCGTFFGSALIAELILKLQGII